MIIINADDWGRTRAETDAALSCYREQRITSASAMVFMEDSERAADLAGETGIDLGLHLNLTQHFSGKGASGLLREYHDRIVRYLTVNEYVFLIYNPLLRKEFQYVYQAQADQFQRLYGKPPSHIDGHHHQHLCANMLLDGVIPEAEKVRRNFFFWPGEKNIVNRTYRRLVDLSLARRYRLADFFFALSHCLGTGRMTRIVELAQTAVVEIMTHPVNASEHTYLMSDDFPTRLAGAEKGTYSSF
jgi:chitin disaccharide deacetylase